MTKKEFQNKYSPKYDEITINGVTISYDCYEINVEDGKDVVCFYNEGGYCFMCSIPLEDVDLINRQQAENKELKTDKIIAERKEKDARELFKNAVLQIEQAKTKAIKEFAERLKAKYKKHFSSEWSAVYNTIDNLIKEMVGEGK